MSLSTLGPSDRDTVIRVNFVRATNRIIPQSFLEWYRGIWPTPPDVNGIEGSQRVLLDIWEKWHYQPEKIPTS